MLFKAMTKLFGLAAESSFRFNAGRPIAARNKEVNVMNIYIRLDARPTSGSAELGRRSHRCIMSWSHH